MPIQTAADSISNSAGSPYGFKNRIMNGAMVIDQRNAGSSTTPSGDAYNLDRWQAAIGTAGSWFTFQQSSVVPANFTNSLSILSTGANSVSSGSIYVLQHRIEGYNVADLGYGSSDAKPISISFWIRGSVTGTYGLVVSNGAINRAYPITYTINSADTWEYKTVTIAGDTSGTWLKDNGIGMRLIFQLGTGSSSLITSGTGWVTPSGNAYGVTGTTNLSATNGATLYITGVQLEKGTQATAFDYRPYSTELALCQRYFESAFPVGTAVSAGAAYFWYTNVTTYASTVGRSQWIDFKVTKRVTPTITPYRTNIVASNDNSWAIYNAGTWTNSSTATSCPATHHGFYAEVAASGLSGIPYSYICIGAWVASAEL